MNGTTGDSAERKISQICFCLHGRLVSRPYKAYVDKYSRRVRCPHRTVKSFVRRRSVPLSVSHMLDSSPHRGEPMRISTAAEPPRNDEG